MTWQSGESGNPGGRPSGARSSINRWTTEVVQESKDRGYRHPLTYMLEVMEDPNAAPERRDNMAVAAGRIVPKFNPTEKPFEVPHFSTLEEGEDYLQEIPRMVGRREISEQTGVVLSALVKNWTDTQIKHRGLELEQLRTPGGGSPDQVIKIEGGLPTLPGTNINMSNEPSNVPPASAMNGYAVDPEPEPPEPPPGNEQ